MCRISSFGLFGEETIWNEMRTNRWTIENTFDCTTTSFRSVANELFFNNMLDIVSFSSFFLFFSLPLSFFFSLSFAWPFDLFVSSPPGYTNHFDELFVQITDAFTGGNSAFTLTNVKCYWIWRNRCNHIQPKHTCCGNSRTAYRRRWAPIVFDYICPKMEMPMRSICTLDTIWWITGSRACKRWRAIVIRCRRMWHVHVIRCGCHEVIRIHVSWMFSPKW